jgi:hypothetical protein
MWLKKRKRKEKEKKKRLPSLTNPNKLLSPFAQGGLPKASNLNAFLLSILLVHEDPC